MPILDTVTGWQVEEGDFLILHGMECQVKELIDDSEADFSVFRVYVLDDQDYENVKIYLNQSYEIWGE